tara:strand:+ start:2131 stop:4839 length:2709 start_codon:yes stop_codon:yes gene_type:complete
LKKIIKESDLKAYIRWSLLKENLTPADEKALLKASQESKRAFKKMFQKLMVKYHTDKGTGPRGANATTQLMKARDVALKGFKAGNSPGDIKTNLKNSLKADRMNPKVLKKAQEAFTKATAEEAKKAAAREAASKGTFKAAEKKAAAKAAQSAAFQSNMDSAKKGFKSAPKPSTPKPSTPKPSTPKPSAPKLSGPTTPKLSGPTSKPPNKASQKIAQKLIDKNPVIKKTLENAAKKMLPGAADDIVKVAAKNTLALGIQQGEKELAKQGAKFTGQLALKTVSTALVPVVAGTGVVATGTTLSMLLSIPVSIAGSVGYFTGTQINNYFTGDIKNEYYSIKKQAKGKLNMLYMGGSWDMSSDDSFKEKALEVGFKGMNPRDIDPKRRKNVFDVMTAALIASDAGASELQINASLAEPYMKYNELFDMGYLDRSAWERAARREKAKRLASEVSIENIEVVKIEGGQSQEDIVTPEDTETEEILPKPSNIASDWAGYMSKATGKIDKRDTEQIYQLWRGGDAGTSGVSEKTGKTKSFQSWARWYTTLYKTGKTGVAGADINVPEKGDLIIGGRKWTPGTHLSPTAVRIIMQKIYRGEPMQLSESKLRKLIKKVLTEVVSLPAALKSSANQISIQKAMIDKLDITGDANKINAALGVKNGKPDGKIGPKSLSTWKAITGKESFDDATSVDAAKQLIKKGNLTKPKPEASPEASSPEASSPEASGATVKKALEDLQSKKRSLKIKTLRVAEDILDYGLAEMMEYSTNESSVISGLEKVSKHFTSHNKILKKMLKQEKILWEELIVIEPELLSDYVWGSENYLPWDPDIDYIIVKGNLWAINIFSLVIKNATSKVLNKAKSIIDWYDSALSGDDFNTMKAIVFNSIPKAADDPYNKQDKSSIRAEYLLEE